jgi:hypothetical protein
MGATELNVFMPQLTAYNEVKRYSKIEINYSNEVQLLRYLTPLVIVYKIAIL